MNMKSYRKPCRKMWIVQGKSESGDSYGPKSYDHYPDEFELRDFIKTKTPEELDCGGPGDFGSYVYIKVDMSMIDVK